MNNQVKRCFGKNIVRICTDIKDLVGERENLRHILCPSTLFSHLDDPSLFFISMFYQTQEFLPLFPHVLCIISKPRLTLTLSSPLLSALLLSSSTLWFIPCLLLLLTMTSIHHQFCLASLIKRSIIITVTTNLAPLSSLPSIYHLF